LAHYRGGFWQLARQAHRSGQFDTLFGVWLVSYHLIEFSREALRGRQNAAFTPRGAGFRTCEVNFNRHSKSKELWDLGAHR
jgi:hypothetical protein